MPIGLVLMCGTALFFLLASRVKIPAKYEKVETILMVVGWPACLALVALLFYWLGVWWPEDRECVKWDWHTGDCVKYE